MSSGEGQKADGGTHLPKYEWVGELGSGRKGEIKLMRNRRTQELVAVKYIARQVGVGSLCQKHTCAHTAYSGDSLVLHQSSQLDEANDAAGWCWSQREH